MIIAKRIFLLTTLAALAAPLISAGIVVGLPADTGTGNCAPFGCAYTTDYQQVYSHTEFSGPITITALEFFNKQYDAGATAMNSGLWTISLSTTATDWNTLSSTYANNIGADNTTVFSGDLAQPWTFGSTLTITLSTPFTYDPSKGNLLMDVLASGTSNANGDIFFDTNGLNGFVFNGNTFLGRVFCDGCGIVSGSVDNGYGLVTGFSTRTTVVPEPGTVVMLALAGALVAVRRRMA
jgi:hypothetical protein